MMTSKEIWEAIEKLTVVEKLRLIEDIARSIRKELSNNNEAEPNVSRRIE